MLLPKDYYLMIFVMSIMFLGVVVFGFYF